MAHTYYLIGLLIATALGWSSWVVVINNLSPFISGYLALSFFYASLMVALTGSFSLLSYFLRYLFGRMKQPMKQLNRSLRQGSLLAAMICIGLVFQRLRVLTWWDAGLLLVIVLLIEYYFMKSES